MAASTIDLSSSIDPTGYASITGAQLLQLIAGANPYTDKGFVVTTTDSAGAPVTPNANATTKWKRYIWLRIRSDAVDVYVWNPYTANADTALLNWQSVVVAGIGAGSIVANMIADNTISDIKIVSLDWSKITSKPSFIAGSDAALGDLVGSTWALPTIAPNAIGTSKIALNAVTHAQLAAKAIQPATDILGNGSAADMIRVSGGDPTYCEYFTPNDLVKSSVPNLAGNSLKIPQVNLAATAYQMVALTTVGRLLSYTIQHDATTGTALAIFVPAQIKGDSGTAIGGLKVTNWTPVNAASTIIVRVTAYLDKTSLDSRFGLYLIKTATGVSVAGVNVDASEIVLRGAALDTHIPIVLIHKYAPMAIVGYDFIVGGLIESGAGNYNPSSGYTPNNKATIEIFEYI